MSDTRHAVILEGAEFSTDLEGELEKGPAWPPYFLAGRVDERSR